MVPNVHYIKVCRSFTLAVDDSLHEHRRTKNISSRCFKVKMVSDCSIFDRLHTPTTHQINLDLIDSDHHPCGLMKHISEEEIHFQI